MTTKTVRPKDLDREWCGDGEYCCGIMQLHPKQDIASVRLIGLFGPKDAKKMRQFAKWLTRAADYIEERV